MVSPLAPTSGSPAAPSPASPSAAKLVTQHLRAHVASCRKRFIDALKALLDDLLAEQIGVDDGRSDVRVLLVPEPRNQLADRDQGFACALGLAE
jgi:hypothetical protein